MYTIFLRIESWQQHHSSNTYNRAVLNGKKKVFRNRFSQKSAGTPCAQPWLVAVGGWRRLAVGSWQLAVGGGWRRLVLVIGGWWRLAAVGGWRLVAVGG